jgi:hypothetical protein
MLFLTCVLYKLAKGPQTISFTNASFYHHHCIIVKEINILILIDSMGGGGGSKLHRKTTAPLCKGRQAWEFIFFIVNQYLVGLWARLFNFASSLSSLLNVLGFWDLSVNCSYAERKFCCLIDKNISCLPFIDFLECTHILTSLIRFLSF